MRERFKCLKPQKVEHVSSLTLSSLTHKPGYLNVIQQPRVAFQKPTPPPSFYAYKFSPSFFINNPVKRKRVISDVILKRFKKVEENQLFIFVFYDKEFKRQL